MRNPVNVWMEAFVVLKVSNREERERANVKGLFSKKEHNHTPALTLEPRERLMGQGNVKNQLRGLALVQIPATSTGVIDVLTHTFASY